MANHLPIPQDVFGVIVNLLDALANWKPKEDFKWDLLYPATGKVQQVFDPEHLGFARRTWWRLKVKEELTRLSNGELIYCVTHVIDATSANPASQRFISVAQPTTILVVFIFPPSSLLMFH